MRGEFTATVCRVMTIIIIIIIIIQEIYEAPTLWLKALNNTD